MGTHSFETLINFIQNQDENKLMKKCSISSDFLAIFAIGVLFFAGCGKTDTPKSDSSEIMLSDEELLIDLTPESVVNIIPASEKAITLVNVWATWCAPCIKEFPYLVQLQETYPEELEVVFISADFPEDRSRAIEFLREQRVNKSTYLKSGRDLPFIAALSENWSGSIPFTQLYLPDGTIFAEWSGEADLERFEELFLLAKQKL